MVVSAQVTAIEEASGTGDLQELYPRASSYAITPEFLVSGKRAALAVSEVWKGRANAAESLAYSASTPACGFELALGQNIVLFADRTSNGTLVSSRHGVGGIGVRAVDGTFLARYRAQTANLREKAAAGAKGDELAFGTHLTRWNDPEALEVYRRLVERYDRDADLYLGLGIAGVRHGDRDEAERAFRKAAELSPDLAVIGNGAQASQSIKMASLYFRGLFILTGFIDDQFEDWSNLTARANCDAIGITLTSADFSASNVTRCSFKQSQLTKVSFANADLSNVSFENGVLRDVSFLDARLAGGRFAWASLEDIVWEGSDLRHADFARTRNAGPFQRAALEGASFEYAINPGPFLAAAKGKPISLAGVSFRNASLAVSAFLTADGYSPEAELQADISRADFTGATIDCGERDLLRLVQGINAAPDTFLARFQHEQQVARYVRDHWQIAGLTERCQRYVELKLKYPMPTSATP